MVRKDDLLKYVTEQARKEASHRGLDEHATEVLASEAKDIVEDLFTSITWETVENGVIKSNDPLWYWRHRGANDDLESDWRHMHFTRADLQNAAERYLDREWLHCRELDWFIVNVLTYAECQATLDFLRSRSMPMSRYISKKVESIKFKIFSGLWRGIVFIVKLALWIGIFAATFVAAPYGPIAWFGITAFWVWYRWSSQSKIDKILKSMFDTYYTLDTVSQSWQIVWDELKRSRGAGAMWDGIVYRLVEARIRHDSYQKKA